MLITSELTNQSARKALFTCVVYTNVNYLANNAGKNDSIKRNCPSPLLPIPRQTSLQESPPPLFSYTYSYVQKPYKYFTQHPFFLCFNSLELCYPNLKSSLTLKMRKISSRRPTCQQQAQWSVSMLKRNYCY